MPALTIPVPSPSLDYPSDPISERTLPNPYPRLDPPRLPRASPDAAYTHPPFDDGAVSPSLQPQLTTLLSNHFTLSQPFSSWQSNVQIIHNNPYPPPQPPPLVHKVWILDCMSCGTFLTNRGMKAVLLLRPNVSLFSTDALPLNCSAYSTNPDALRPPCRPSIAPSPPRTCDCVTQTLCCHTCGTAVGYMIVIPCFRCTSSISATNRATNGHRFVFHSSEIVASERHHVSDEPGVLPFEHPSPPPPPSSPPPLTPAYPAVFHPADAAAHRQLGGSVDSRAYQLAPSLGFDYLPSSQTEALELGPSSPLFSPDLLATVPPDSPRQSVSRAPSPETRGMTLELCPRKLKAGDVLYWHHLTKHGEILGVEEDPRARMSNRRNPLTFFER